MDTERHADGGPAERWRRAVLAREPPRELVAAAPAPPPTLVAERFRWDPEHDARQPVRPSRRRALEALPAGGTVLDVGVGGGASSLGLAPRVGHITGVDPLEPMLELFSQCAAAAGVGATAVLGTWPQVAGEVQPADVAVCHHALYNVADAEPFFAALTAHARHRVVIELSAAHPLSALDPLWQRFHGIERPERNVADDAEQVLLAMGFAVARQDMALPAAPVPEVTPAMVEFARRRLYVGPERDPEIAEFLDARTPRRHVVAALWWPGDG